MSIRLIRPTDFTPILRINAESRPHVAALDAQQIEHLCTQGVRGWVAEWAQQPVGYLLAIHSAANADMGDEFPAFKRRLAVAFVYIDQIAVEKRVRGQGWGTALYEAVARWALRQGVRTLCCEVNIRPANVGSLQFHRRLGFDGSDEIETTDGRRVVLLSKALLGKS